MTTRAGAWRRDRLRAVGQVTDLPYTHLVMTTPSFEGRRVLALESRRAKEIATLISNLDGDPFVAPSLREVPLESNSEALDFAAALQRGEFDIVVFLTGVGTRALVEVVGRTSPRESFIAALARTRVVARGPKPLAVLRELNVPVWVVAPEPNTWRELLAAIDARADESPLSGARVAVQEYGVSNVELLDALRGRGAQVTRVPVYQWALPEDLEPLKQAVTAISQASIDVVILTSGVQLAHLFQVAGAMGLEDEIRRGLAATVIASIGPTTSEEVERRGLQADLAASHPKMGVLVREAAEQCGDLLRTKRAAAAPTVHPSTDSD
jgi:uroporphyrinogen-III synthase